MPKLSRRLYEHRITDLICRSHQGADDGYEFPIPSLRTWPFGQVKKWRAKAVCLEATQPTDVWESLGSQNTPPVLHKYVVRALWRKLQVGAHLFAFRVLRSDECTLCGSKQHHEHVLKKCRFLHDNISIVRCLWHSAICDNWWMEPSRLCLDHSRISIESPHGWLMWSAINGTSGVRALHEPTRIFPL